MSPTSGTGGDEDFFNDMLNKPASARPPPPQPQPPTAPPAPVAAAAPVPATRTRRAPPPPGAKRAVPSSSGTRQTAPSSGPRSASSSSSSVGVRKVGGSTSASSVAPRVSATTTTPGAAAKAPSYYLKNDASGTSNNNNHSHKENMTPSAPPMFYPSAATGTTTSAAATSNSYYGASSAAVGADPSSMDWYTPSAMTATTPAPSEPTIINPYMQPQPIGYMDALSPLTSDTSFIDGDDPYANEPPLMEELGINVEHIAWKTRAVVLPFSRWVVRMRNKGYHEDDDHPMLNPQAMAQDADLAGPIAFAVLLGAELLLAGKLQFGYIYGFGLFGCMSMTLILNLLQPQPEVARLTSDPSEPVPTTMGISFWSVTSILGYSLLPVNGLAAFKLLLVNNPFWKLHTLLRMLAVIVIAWSTIASTRLFEQGFGFRDQRYLIAYPIALLYSAFVLITIF